MIELESILKYCAFRKTTLLINIFTNDICHIFVKSVSFSVFIFFFYLFIFNSIKEEWDVQDH